MSRKKYKSSGTRKGNGAGWGGPAKGSSPHPHKNRPAFSDTPGPGRGNYSIPGEAKAQRNERHAEEMRELYYTFAHDIAKKDEVRMTAATHLLNRIEGMPASGKDGAKQEVKIIVENGTRE